MSSAAAGDSNSISVCAACGKSGDNLKACMACHLVKYCNRECQNFHRPKHKKECRKRAAELKHAGGDNTSNSIVNEISEGISNASISDSASGSTDKKTSTSYEQNNEDFSKVISDDELFKDPPPKEECPICMQPMPYEFGICGVEVTYQTCCGKVICYGCMKAAEEEIQAGNMKDWCAFCRVPYPYTDREIKKRWTKRVKLNDVEAFLGLAADYRGNMGSPKNEKKVFELLSKAADLGSCRAHYQLSNMYHKGEAMEKDMEKAIHHARLAAIGGHEVARHNLGAAEEEKGKKAHSIDQGIHHMKQAMKHYMIAARSGYDRSLKLVGNGYKKGLVTKEEYTSTLRSIKYLVMR